MLKRYQSPKSDPSTNVSLNFDFSLPPSALSGTEAALTSNPSDSRGGTCGGAEIQPFSLGGGEDDEDEEEEMHIEGNRLEDEAETP